MKKPCLLFCCLLSFSVVAQEVNDSLSVNALIQKGNAYFYTNQDSAYYYFDKITRICTEKKEWAPVIIALISIDRIASYHYNLNKMKSSLDALEGIFKNQNAALKALPDYVIYRNSLLYDKGVYYFETNNYKQSQEAFQEIIAFVEKMPDSLLTKETTDLLTGAYSYVAKMNCNEGRYDVARQYYRKNIRFISEKTPDDKRSLFINYSLLADLFKRTKDFKKSTAYYTKALDYNLGHHGNQNTIISLAQSLALNYISLKQPDSARFYLQVLKDKLTAGHPFWNKYHGVKAAIYKVQHKDSLALNEYRIALALTRQKWHNSPHPEMAGYEHKIGLLYAALNNVTAALAHYDRAISLLNKKALRVSSGQKLLLKILKDKARVLNKSATPESYKATIKTVDFAIRALDSLKPSFKSEADKLVLIDDAFPLFESGMEAAYNLYRSTKDAAYLDRAFFYSEKSKSVLLFEALLSAKATRFGEVPEELLEQDKQLKAEISHVEKKIFASRSVSDAEKDQLFALKKRHRRLLKTIETHYKSYYDLKYNTQVISADAFQQALDGKTLLLSYFFGTRALYCMGISHQKMTFRQIPVGHAFSSRIIAYYHAMSNPKSNLRHLEKQSFALYAAILQNELREFPERDRLIIVPDGLLNYIPFGQLNSSAQNLHYVIEDRAISYVSSATLLTQLSEKKKAPRGFLGFAPRFNGSQTDGLLPLANNKEEVKSIMHYFDGKALVGPQATLYNFTSQSGDYGILHFATHAVLNDSIPAFSYLAFQPQNGREHLLYVSDLYNLSLNSKLVTLSACESGIGNLRRGEGFMSLARGFYFSGVSAIASSLWKINDASSAKIMENFYKHLSGGDEKDVALQKAKLDFLKENKDNGLSHPYYWSGFVVSGKTSAVVDNNASIS